MKIGAQIHLRRQLLRHFPLAGRSLAMTRAQIRFHLDRELRNCFHENLTAAFPEKAKGEIQSLARRVALTIEANRADQRRLEILTDAEIDRTVANVSIQGRLYFEEFYRAGRPVILVTPHYGRYMLGARCVARSFAKNGLYFFYNPPERNSYAESSNRLLERPNSGCHKIYNNSHGIKTALKALRSGGVLCMMPDLISVTTSSLYVPFFGRFFTAMAGTAFLALRSNAVIVPVYCFPKNRWGGEAVLEFHSPLNVQPSADWSFADQVYQLTAELFRDLENQIRARPEQWKYWHVFLKRSLPFPRPAASRESLIQQLSDEQICSLVAGDDELGAVISDWSAALVAEGPQRKGGQ